MTFTSNSDKTTGRKCSSDVQFSNFVLSQSTTGRISRTVITTRAQLLKLSYDKYSISTCRNVALSILRGIKDTPVRIRKTRTFVREVCHWLTILNNYNRAACETKGKFPFSKALIYLLVGYVQLEYHVLYYPENYSVEYEKEVERRVLRMLHIVLDGAEKKLGHKNSEYAVSKCALRVLNKVNAEYKEEGKLVCTLITKLLKRLKLWDTVTRIQENPMSVLENDSILETLSCDNLDYISDCDSDDSIEYPISPSHCRTFSPFSDKLKQDCPIKLEPPHLDSGQVSHLSDGEKDGLFYYKSKSTDYTSDEGDYLDLKKDLHLANCSVHIDNNRDNFSNRGSSNNDVAIKSTNEQKSCGDLKLSKRSGNRLISDGEQSCSSYSFLCDDVSSSLAKNKSSKRNKDSETSFNVTLEDPSANSIPIINLDDEDDDDIIDLIEDDEPSEYVTSSTVCEKPVFQSADSSSSISTRENYHQHAEDVTGRSDALVSEIPARAPTRSFWNMSDSEVASSSTNHDSFSKEYTSHNSIFKPSETSSQIEDKNEASSILSEKCFLENNFLTETTNEDSTEVRFKEIRRIHISSPNNTSAKPDSSQEVLTSNANRSSVIRSRDAAIGEKRYLTHSEHDKDIMNSIDEDNTVTSGNQLVDEISKCEQVKSSCTTTSSVDIQKAAAEIPAKIKTMPLRNLQTVSIDEEIDSISMGDDFKLQEASTTLLESLEEPPNTLPAKSLLTARDVSNEIVVNEENSLQQLESANNIQKQKTLNFKDENNIKIRDNQEKENGICSNEDHLIASSTKEVNQAISEVSSLSDTRQLLEDSPTESKKLLRSSNPEAVAVIKSVIAQQEHLLDKEDVVNEQVQQHIEGVNVQGNQNVDTIESKKNDDNSTLSGENCKEKVIISILQSSEKSPSLGKEKLIQTDKLKQVLLQTFGNTDIEISFSSDLQPSRCNTPTEMKKLPDAVTDSSNEEMKTKSAEIFVATAESLEKTANTSAKEHPIIQEKDKPFEEDIESSIDVYNPSLDKEHHLQDELEEDNIRDVLDKGAIGLTKHDNQKEDACSKLPSSSDTRQVIEETSIVTGNVVLDRLEASNLHLTTPSHEVTEFGVTGDTTESISVVESSQSSLIIDNTKSLTTQEIDIVLEEDISTSKDASTNAIVEEDQKLHEVERININDDQNKVATTDLKSDDGIFLGENQKEEMTTSILQESEKSPSIAAIKEEQSLTNELQQWLLRLLDNAISKDDIDVTRKAKSSCNAPTNLDREDTTEKSEDTTEKIAIELQNILALSGEDDLRSSKLKGYRSAVLVISEFETELELPDDFATDESKVSDFHQDLTASRRSNQLESLQSDVPNEHLIQEKKTENSADNLLHALESNPMEAPRKEEENCITPTTLEKDVINEESVLKQQPDSGATTIVLDQVIKSVVEIQKENDKGLNAEEERVETPDHVLNLVAEPDLSTGIHEHNEARNIENDVEKIQTLPATDLEQVATTGIELTKETDAASQGLTQIVLDMNKGEHTSSTEESHIAVNVQPDPDIMKNEVSKISTEESSFPDCNADTVCEEITKNEENLLIRYPNTVNDANKVENIINLKSNDKLVTDADIKQMPNTTCEEIKNSILDSLYHECSGTIIGEEKDISKEINEEIGTNDNSPPDLISKEVETDINPKSNDELVSVAGFEQIRNTKDGEIKDPISQSIYHKDSSEVGTEVTNKVETVVNPKSSDELVTDVGFEQMRNATDGKIKEPKSDSLYHEDSSSSSTEEKDIPKDVNEEVGTTESGDNSPPDLISKEVETGINPKSNEALATDTEFAQMRSTTDAEIIDPISDPLYHEDSSTIISEEKDISKEVNEEVGTTKYDNNCPPDLISKEMETVINPKSDELVGVQHLSNITDGAIGDSISESFYHEDSSAIISEKKDISKEVNEEIRRTKSDDNSPSDLMSKEVETDINPKSNDELVSGAGLEQMKNTKNGEVKDQISESFYHNDSSAIISEEKDISKQINEEIGTSKPDDNSPPNLISKEVETDIIPKSDDELVSDAGFKKMRNTKDGESKDPISELFYHQDSSEEKDISKEVNKEILTLTSDDNTPSELISKEVVTDVNPKSNDTGFEQTRNIKDGEIKDPISESFYHKDSTTIISEEKDISKEVNEEVVTSTSHDNFPPNLICKEVHEIETEGEEVCNLNTEQQEISGNLETCSDSNTEEEHCADSKDILVDDGKVILILQSDDATKDENFVYIIDADQLGDDKDVNFVFDEENIEEHRDRKEETDILETVESNSEIQEVPETKEYDNDAHYFESSDIPTTENEVCVECYEYQNDQQESDGIPVTDDDKSETAKKHVESNQIAEKCSDTSVKNEIAQSSPMANDISVAISSITAQDINKEYIPMTLQPHQNNETHDELPIAKVTIESEHFKQSFEVPLDSINKLTENKSIEGELHENIEVSKCESLQPYAANSLTQMTNNSPGYFGVRNKFEISFEGANNLDVKKSFVIQPPEQVAEEKLFFLATVAASQEFLEVAPKDPNQTQTTGSSKDDCKDSLKVPLKKGLNVGNGNSKQVRSRVKMAGRSGSKMEKNLKPYEISENIPNQSAITISTTATESDFNTISEDSCDSFFSGKLVIAEDSKHQESSPVYSGNEYQQSNFDESIYDEDTVEENIEFVKTTLDDVANTEVQISISDSEEFMAYEGYFPYIDKLRESYNYEPEIKFGAVTLKNIDKLKDPVLLKKHPEQTEIPKQNFPAAVLEYTQEKDLRKRDGEILSPNEESLTPAFTPTDYSIETILKSQFVRSIELQEVIRDEIPKTSAPVEIASKPRKEDGVCRLDSCKDQVIDDVLTVKKREDEIKTQAVENESIQEVNHGTSETPEEIASKSSKLDKVYQLDSKDHLVNDVSTVEKNQTEKETQPVRSDSIQEGNHVPSEAPAEMVSKSRKRDKICQLDSPKGPLINDVPIVERKENEIETKEIQTKSIQDRNLAKGTSDVTAPSATICHVNKKIKKNKEKRMIDDVKGTEKLAVDEDLTKRVNNSLNNKYQIDRTSDSDIFSVTDANNENIVRHRTKAELKAYDRKCKSEKSDEIGYHRDISFITESVKRVCSETVPNRDQKQEGEIYDDMSDIQIHPKESDKVSMECEQVQNNVKISSSSNEKRMDALVNNTNLVSNNFDNSINQQSSGDILEGTGGIDKFKLHSYVKLVRLPNLTPKTTSFSISRKSYKSLIDTRTLFGKAKNVGHNLQVRDILRMNKQIARSVGCSSDSGEKGKSCNSQKTIEKTLAVIDNKKICDGNENLEENVRVVDCKKSYSDVNTLEKSNRAIKNVEDKSKEEDMPSQDVSNDQTNGSEKLCEEQVMVDLDKLTKADPKVNNGGEKSKSIEEDMNEQDVSNHQKTVEEPLKEIDNKKIFDGSQKLDKEVPGKKENQERGVELLDCKTSDPKSLDVDKMKKSNRKGKNVDNKSKPIEADIITRKTEIVANPLKQLDNKKTCGDNKNLAEEFAAKNECDERVEEQILVDSKKSDANSLKVDKIKKSNRKGRNVEYKSKSKDENTTISKQEVVETPLKQMDNKETSDEKQNLAEEIPGKSESKEREVELLDCKISDTKSLDVDKIKKSSRKGRNAENKTKSKDSTTSQQEGINCQEIVKDPLQQKDNKKTSDENQNLAKEASGKNESQGREVEQRDRKISDPKRLGVDKVKKSNRKGRNVDNKSKPKEENTNTSKQEIVENPLKQVDNKKISGENKKLAEEVVAKNEYHERMEEHILVDSKTSDANTLKVDKLKKSNTKGSHVKEKSKSKEDTTSKQDGIKRQKTVDKFLKKVDNTNTSDENQNLAEEIAAKNGSEERDGEQVVVDSKESRAKTLRVDNFKKSNAKGKNVKDKSKEKDVTSKQDGIKYQKTVEKSSKDVGNKKTLDGNQHLEEVPKKNASKELVLVDHKESNAKSLDADKFKKSNRKGRNAGDKTSKQNVIIDQKIIEESLKEIGNKNTLTPNIGEVIPEKNGNENLQVEQVLVDCKESEEKTVYVGKFKKYNRKLKSVEDDTSKQNVSNDEKTIEQPLKEIDNKSTSDGNRNLTEEMLGKNGNEKSEIEQVPVDCTEPDTKTLHVGKFKKYNRRLKSVEDDTSKQDVINNLKTIEHSLNEIHNKKTTDGNQNIEEEGSLTKPDVEQILVDCKESDAKSLHVGKFKKYNRKSKNVEDMLSKKDDINHHKTVEMSLNEINVKNTSDGNQDLGGEVPGKIKNEKSEEELVLVECQISDKLKKSNRKRKNVDNSKLKESTGKEYVKSTKIKRSSSVNTRNLDSSKIYESDEKKTNDQNTKSRSKKLDGSIKPIAAYSTRSSSAERKSDNSDVPEKNVRVTRASSVEARRNNRDSEEHKPKGKVEEFNEEINNSQDRNSLNQHTMNKKVEKVPNSKNVIVTETKKNNLKEKKQNKEDKPIRKTEKLNDEDIKTQSEDVIDQHPLSTKVKEPYRRTRSSSLVDNQIDNSGIIDRNVKVSKIPSQNKKSNDQDRNKEITTDSTEKSLIESRNISKTNETSNIPSEKAQIQRNIFKAINVQNELNHGKAGFCAIIGLKETEKADTIEDSSINTKQKKLNTHKSVRSPSKSKVKLLINEKVELNTNQLKEIIPDVAAKAEIDAKTTCDTDKNKEQSKDAVEQRTILEDDSTSTKSQDLKTDQPNIDNLSIESNINETSLNIDREIILGIGINLEKLQKVNNRDILKSKGKIENLSSPQKTSKKSNTTKSLPDKSKECTTSPIPIDKLEGKLDDVIKKEDHKPVEKEICTINENQEKLEKVGILVTKTDEQAIKSIQKTEEPAPVLKNDKLTVKDSLIPNVEVEDHLTVVTPVSSNDKQNEQHAVINDNDTVEKKELNVVNQNIEILNEDLKTTCEKSDEISAKQESEEVQVSEVNKKKLKEVTAKSEIYSRKRTIDEIKEPQASEKHDEKTNNHLVSVQEKFENDGEVIEAKRQKISRKSTTTDNVLDTKVENVEEGKEVKDQEHTTAIETVAYNKTASTNDFKKNHTDSEQCLVQKEDTLDTPNEENLKTIALPETDQKSSGQQEEKKSYLGKMAILKREAFVCLERLKVVDDKILEVMSKKAQNDEILQNKIKRSGEASESKVEEKTDEKFIINQNKPEIVESKTEVLKDNEKPSSELDLQIEEKSESLCNDLKLTNQEVLTPKLDINILKKETSIAIDKNKPVEETKADSSNILSSNLGKEPKLTEENTSKETNAESVNDKLHTAEMKQASNKTSTDFTSLDITDDKTKISQDNGKLSLDKIEYKSECEVPIEILAEKKEDNVPLIIDEVLKKYKADTRLTKSIIKKGCTSLDGVSGRSGEVRTYPPKKRVTFNIKDEVLSEGDVKNLKSNEPIIRNDAIDFKPALKKANLKTKIVRGETNVIRKHSEMEANQIIDLKDVDVVPDETRLVNTKDIQASMLTVTKKKRKSQDESESPESKKAKEKDYPKIEIEKLKLSVKHKLEMNTTSREGAITSPTKRNGRKKDIDTIINHLRNRDHQMDSVKQDLEEKLEITIIDVIDEQKGNAAMEDIKSAIKDFENQKGNFTGPRESSEDGVRTNETAIDETFTAEEEKRNEDELLKEVCTNNVTVAVAEIPNTISIEENTIKNSVVADLIQDKNSENITTNVVPEEKSVNLLKEEGKLVNRKSKEQSVNNIGAVNHLKIVEEDSSISDNISARITKTFQDDSTPSSTTLDHVSKENPPYFPNENKEDEETTGKSEVVAKKINIEEIPSDICNQPLPTPASTQSIDKPAHHETMDIQVSQISENNTTSSAATAVDIIKDNLPSLDVKIEKISEKSEVIDMNSTAEQVNTQEIPCSVFDQTFITPSTETVDKPENHEKTVEESFVSDHSSSMIDVQVPEASENGTTTSVSTMSDVPSLSLHNKEVSETSKVIDVSSTTKQINSEEIPMTIDDDNITTATETSKVIDISSTTKQINVEEIPMSIDDDNITTSTAIETVDGGDNSNNPTVSRNTDFEDQQQHSDVSISPTGCVDEGTPINDAPQAVIDSVHTKIDERVPTPTENLNKKSIVDVKPVSIKLNDNTSTTNTTPEKREFDVSYDTASTSRDVSDKNNLLNNFDLSTNQSKNLDAFTPPISDDAEITEVVISAAAKLSNLISWPGDTVPDSFLSNSDSEHASIQTEASMQEDIFGNSNLEYFPEQIAESAKEENVPRKVDRKPDILQNVERKTQVLAPMPVTPVKEHSAVDNSLKTSVPTTVGYGSSHLSAITTQISSYVGDRILSIGENDLPVTPETTAAAPGKIFDPIDEDTLLTDKLKERGSMRFGGTSDHDYSAGLGGPFLVSTEDNDNILSFSEESVCMRSLMSNNLTQEQDERGSTEDLSNSPVDNTIFPSVCIGTFMDHDLTQEAGRSLNHSPVDGANNYQFNTTLTEDINSLIDLREESLSVAQMNDLMMDNHHGSILHHLGMDDHHGTNLALSNIAKISEENRKYLSEFDLVDQENIISRIVSGENVIFPHHQTSKEISESVAATSEPKSDVAMLKVEVKYNEHAYQSSDRIKNVICPELSKNDMFKVSSKSEAKQKDKTDEIIENKPLMKLPCEEHKSTPPKVPSTLRKNDMFKISSKSDEKQKQKTAQSVEKKPCEEQGSSPKASSALRAQVMLDMQKKKYETKPKDTHLGYPIRQNSRTPVCAPVKKDSPVHHKRSPEQITNHSSTSPPGTPLKLLMTQTEGNRNISTSSPIHTKEVVVEKPVTQVTDTKEVRKVLEKPKEDIEEIAKDKLKDLLVNIVIGKARSETPKINHAQLATSLSTQQSTPPARQENATQISHIDQSRSTPSRQQFQSNSSKSETPKADSSKKYSPATPSGSKQDIFDARKHNDFYVDKYTAIKSKRRQCTERLIDNLAPEKLLKVEEDAKNRSKLDDRSKRGKSNRTPKHRQLVDYDDSSLSDEQAVNKYDKDQRRNERERLIVNKRGADSPGDLEPLSKRKQPLTEEVGSIDEQKKRMLNKKSGGDSSDDELSPGGELKKPLTQEELNAAFDKLVKEGSVAKDDTKPSDNKNKILNFDNKNASPCTSAMNVRQPPTKQPSNSVSSNVKRTPPVQDSRRDKSVDVRAYNARPHPNQLTPSPSGRQQSIPPRKEKLPNGRSYQGRSSMSQQQSNTPAIILNQHQQRNMYEYYSSQRHNPRSRYSCLPENTSTRKPTDRSRSQANVPYQYLSNVRVGNPRTSQDLTWMKYVSPFLPKPPVTFGTEKEEHQ